MGERSDEQKTYWRQSDWRSIAWKVGTPYGEFVGDEDIPVHEGYAIDDVAEIEVGDWDRTGGRGAIVNLEGHEGLNDIHVHEIPPGEELTSRSPLFEEIVVVISGNGATRINPGTEDETVFEWQPWSMFFLPRNVPYQHINLGDDEPARMVADTDLPVLFRLFRDPEFIFDNPYEFPTPEEGDYGEGQVGAREAEMPTLWDANFVPDLSVFEELENYLVEGGTNAKFRFPYAHSLRAHASEYPVGMYKNAHRHSGGTSILMLKGEGYTLMWSDKNPNEKIRVDYQPRTLFTPPTHWFHQHFNVSQEPARFIAMYAPNVLPRGPDNTFYPRKASNRIELVDEDPEIREEFEEELAERGLSSRMPLECYTDPDHELNLSFEEAKTQFEEQA